MTVNPAALAAVSHTSTSTVTVYDAAGNSLGTLGEHGGSVSVQYGQAVRRSCSLAVADPALIPRNPGDLLHPLSGNTLRVRRAPAGGDAFPDLGRFVITGGSVKRGSDGTTVDVQGTDYSEYVAPIGYTIPTQIPAGPAGQRVAAFLTARWPSIVTDMAWATQTISTQTFGETQGSDPWRDAQSVLAGVGYDLYFDTNGTCVARTVPSPSAAAVADYGPGGFRVITTIERPLTRADVYTGVVVVSTNPVNNAIFVAEKWDTNPASPTYANGPLGRRPYMHTSSVVGSQAAADALAVAELAKRSGRGDTYTLGMVPNPALDVGQVITVQFDSSSSPVNVLIDSLDVPLSAADEMRVTCRTVLATD